MQPEMRDQRPGHGGAGWPEGDIKEWLAAIVEFSDDAIIGKTLDSRVRSWNAGAARMFGYERDEIVGQSIMILIPPDRHEEEEMILNRIAHGERVDHFETVRLRKDGSPVEISLSVSPIRDTSGTIAGAAKIARDITEAKRLQRAEHEHTHELQQLATELEMQIEEAQALQEELEHSNDELARAGQEALEANAAKSQFLAMVSHELRTPLNAIAGYVELLEMEIPGPLTKAQRFDLARIKRSQETLLRLIEDILGFAKLESGRLEYHVEEVDLDEFLDSLEAMIAPRLAQKRLTYGLEKRSELGIITIDRAKVEQIALNLLSNAVKFTSNGRIDVRCTATEDEFCLEVRDTGCGIRPEVVESIFEPFVQGDQSLTRTAEGTGLGLSISRQFARAMGGDITVASIVNVGSTFRLTLPVRPTNRVSA